MTDATNMSAIDRVWTNFDVFNLMNFDIDASIDAKYAFGHIPSIPGYIRNMKFGIVDANVLVVHHKLGPIGEYEVNRETFTCPQPSNLNPIADKVLECRMNNGTNVFQVDSGDRYFLTYTITTGGYRELVNTDNSQLFATEIYDGVSSQQNMEYRFDYDKPVHCQEFGTCSSGEVPLQLEEDITKKPIKPKWSGWSDRDLSVVKRYAFEVWKMEYSLDYSVLREPDILTDYNPVPEFITEVLASNNAFPEYEPKGPGVYSTILEVADRANNSRYVRRIAIFDKSSEISIKSSYRLFVSSASNQSNFSWQTTPNSQQTTTLIVQWENHFINEVHENGHFLARVQDYTPRLSDEGKRVDYKKIESQFDDYDGSRTKNEISNINSIVRFEINHGTPSTIPPTNGWENIFPLTENKSIVLSGVNIRDGDPYQVWVRAHDVMGNEKTDSTVVHFDHSPPLVYPPTFKKNIDDGKFPFSSSVTVAAKDEDSGISKVSFKFVVSSTGKVKNQKDFMINSQTQTYCNQLIKECYCISKGECFMIDSVLDIDNCWLKVPIDRTEDEVHSLQVIVYNLAMLSSMTSYNLGKVDSFNGIKEYYSPSNITISKTSDTSLGISWIQAPSCYDRAGILIRLFRPDNTTRDFKVHKDATTFDLTGLSPTTHYWFELFTKYGNDTNFVMSGSPAILKFQTAEASVGFPPGGVAGLSAGFILLLVVVVVVLLFLGRTGRLQPAKARMTQGIRTIRNTIRVRSQTNGGYNNRAYSSKFDDDIYYYGQMNTSGATSSIISRKDTSLESELTQGKFATMYLAKYYGNHRDAQTVVAKVVKDDQKEENVMKMKAKINFYTEKVGHHKNVVDFIGYVEDDVRGSFMVLEYCESGVLKEFLISKKSDITVDLEERLFRMVFGVCLGMDYLSSKKVVHRRLAARNILLDHLLEPKITRFGPEPDAEQEGEERIPLKWMAPECMKSTMNANELSDVFSFGVVMWEIFSLGDTPYPGIQSREVATRLKQGYKMKKPEYCDDAFYKIMLKCWHYDPNKRSGFAAVKDQLSKMFQEGPSEEYYYRSNDL
ncbi:fibroblast growth factor receptor 3 [Mytilus galloprovincialis]|uniref:Fibroblast growth factor receptor 3 n=2 Tax=Mytilus galloprovincialis TaxID=29158 RepID=A0A8B6GUJ3_MYTGA|nr:fibroblast growth factor receptor 3 [Mytilus galloprovincialis]